MFGAILEDEKRFLTEKNHRPSSIAKFDDIEEVKTVTQAKEPEQDDDLMAFQRQYQGGEQQRNQEVIEIELRNRRPSIAVEDKRQSVANPNQNI